MATSQNRWPVYESAPPVAELIPGVLHLRVRPGDVAYLFSDLAKQFHARVERVDLKVEEKPGKDDWGWAYRSVRGQDSGFSNHASGTAIDLNATRHPRGVRNTFDPDQRAIIHEILGRYVDPVTGNHVIRWGGNYIGTPDDMHFEINSTNDAVSRVAAKIRREKIEKEEVPDMQVTDQVGLGAKQAEVLNQTGDHKASVGDLYAAMATGAIVTTQQMSQLITEQKETNRLLAELLSRGPS